MRIAILGTGGAGGLLGGKLIRSGHDVEFLARNPHWEALRTTGLRVEGPDDSFSIPAPVLAHFDPVFLVNPEVVILAVKAGQIVEILPAVRAMLGPGTIVLTIQNGVRTVDEVEKAIGPNPTYGGTCYFVSYLVRPGCVRHVGVEPRIIFGNVDNRRRNEKTAIQFLAALREAGIDATIAPNIRRVLWAKIVLAASLGAVGCLTRVAIGEFRRVPATRRILSDVMKEVIHIASHQSIDLAEDCADRTLRFVDAMPFGGSSSLQRDITAGRPSELEYVIGDLVRYAQSSGVDAPLLTWAYSCILATESNARISGRTGAPH